MLTLGEFGPRIAILGTSNSGKSSLAVSIAQKMRLPAVHLDQLRHIPNTNWIERSDDEFAQLHDTELRNDRWVMEGNYSKLMPQRLERATGLILLDCNIWLRYYRYVRRTLRNNSTRAGHLSGGQDRLSWKMIFWIFKTRHKPSVYAGILGATGKPLIACRTAAALQGLYSAWELPQRY